MDAPARSEFRHRDIERNDGFERIGNQVFFAFRAWGVAMFFLAIAAIPAALVYALLLGKLLRLLLGDAAEDAFAGFLAGAWILMSIPIAVYYTWRRARQLDLNRFIVDAHGFEIRNFPKAPWRVSWAEVRKVHYTSDPSDVDYTPELRFETTARNFTLDQDIWPVAPILFAIQRYYKVTEGPLPGRSFWR